MTKQKHEIKPISLDVFAETEGCGVVALFDPKKQGQQESYLVMGDHYARLVSMCPPIDGVDVLLSLADKAVYLYEPQYGTMEINDTSVYDGDIIKSVIDYNEFEINHSEMYEFAETVKKAKALNIDELRAELYDREYKEQAAKSAELEGILNSNHENPQQLAKERGLL